MRRAKAKGANAERELFHLLWQKGYAVARVAGSGSATKPACDLIAGNNKAKIAIEVKVCNSNKKYISDKQIKELISFSDAFGLKPLVAVKFLRRGWYFFSINVLQKTHKAWMADISKGEKLE